MYAEENQSFKEPMCPGRTTGRKMLRLEVRNSQTPIQRKPEWIKTRAKWGPSTRRCRTS
ncbi:hypothetical protein SHIRM173S_13271 [Streptomyces hirsutus]